MDLLRCDGIWKYWYIITTTEKVVQGGAPQLEMGYNPINYRYITYKP
jgi:hypothetical protein